VPRTRSTHRVAVLLTRAARLDPASALPRDELDPPRSGCGCPRAVLGAVPRTSSDQRGHPRLLSAPRPFPHRYIERAPGLRLHAHRVVGNRRTPSDPTTPQGLLAYLEMAAQSMVIRRLIGAQNPHPGGRTLLFYQVTHPRVRFATSNGDGRRRPRRRYRQLDYLKAWASTRLAHSGDGFFLAHADNGLRLADPRDFDPLFGDRRADRLVGGAPARMQVTMDLVPNHTISQHPLVSAALASSPVHPTSASLHLPRRHRPRGITRRTTGVDLLCPRGPGSVEPDGTLASVICT